MRAARYHGREDLRLDDVPEPVTGAGDVKLRVRYAGICGSDLHEYYEGPVFTRATEPHPFSGVMNPVILGHELCGEVVEVGEGVTRVVPGDLVAVEPVEMCGRCDACRAGRRCRDYAIHGYTRASGGFAQVSLVRESMAHRLPAGVGALDGSLIEPLSVGMIAANRTDVVAGETAAVHGLGPIGIATLLALRARGVRVIASDPSALRRDTVRSLGVEDVLDPLETDIVAAVRELTDGVGAAASVDAAGAPAALAACIASTERNRRVILTAVPLRPLAIDVAAFHAAGVFLTSSTGTTPVSTAFDQVIELMADGRYSTSAWTETIAFDAMIEQGFEPLRRQEKVKVVVDMATA